MSSLARIKLCYLWRHKRLANLRSPTRFTELVQLRKLHDRSADLPLMMDKLTAKRMVQQALGKEWIIPTLWQGDRLGDAPAFPTPAIVKARHGCNQYVVLRNPPAPSQWQRLRDRSEKWCAFPYGLWLDEWAYESVPRGVLAEPLMGDGLNLPLDYKIYVFGGTATHVQVHINREQDHHWILLDRNWNRLVPGPELPPRPRSLDAMLEAAERLAMGQHFLRVDFYEIGGKPLFGEFCLYPGSGLDPFAADWIDTQLGAQWLEALDFG